MLNTYYSPRIEEKAVEEIRKTIENFKSKIEARGKLVDTTDLSPEIQALVALTTTTYLNPPIANWKAYPSTQGFWTDYSLSNNAPTKIIRYGDIMNSVVGFNPYPHSITLRITSADVSGIIANNVLLETHVLPSGIFTKEFAYPISASPYTDICLDCSHDLIIKVRQEHLSQESRKDYLQTSYIICTSSYEVYIVSEGELFSLERYLEHFNIRNVS